MFQPDVYSSTPEKKLRKERVLTRGDREKDVEAIKDSLKNRELSDALGEVLDRKDLQLWVSETSIGIQKEYPLAPEEAVTKNQEQINYQKDLIQELETKRPYRDPNFGIGKENPVLSEEEIGKRIESARYSLKHSEERAERLQSGKETASTTEFVTSYKTPEVIGKQDAVFAYKIEQASQKLKEKFRKQVSKFTHISYEKERNIKKGIFGIGNFSEVKEATVLEHYVGLLRNVEKRLQEDPGLNSRHFIREHVLAAAGRKHDRSIVEGYDPAKLDALVESYEAKFKEYEDKLQPFDSEAKKKPSQGPYR